MGYVVYCYSLLVAIGENFEKYMQEFSVLLYVSLQNISVHQVGVANALS